jgi:GWxTD domain-containing protein
MQFMIVRRVLFVGAMMALVAPAFAGKKLSKSDKRWLEHDVAALITEEERELFKDLDSDEERGIFRQIFWLRRDPTPDTPHNEFQINYEARLAAVDRNVQGQGQPGAATDMGKIILLLGVPGRSDRDRAASLDSSTPGSDSEVGTNMSGRFDPGPDAGLTMDGSVGDDRGTGARVRTWVYEANEALGIPDGLEVRFRAQPSFGYRLVRTKELDEILERVRTLAIANSDIDYRRDDEGRLVLEIADPAADMLLDLRDDGVQSSDIPFEVTAAFFRGDDGVIYVPMLIEIDGLSLDWNAEEAVTTVAGLVEDGEGNPLYQFEETATLARESSRHAQFEMPLQLRPGHYTLYLGVRDESSSKLGTKIETLHVPSFDGRQLELSSILLFTEGRKSDDPYGDVGRAFVIGGYQFTPKPDTIYRKTDRFSGVFNAYGYGIGDGEPRLTTRYMFLRGGEEIGQTQEEPFISVSAGAAITVFDLPLSALEPGDYTFRIHVTDHVKNEVVTRDIDFILM